MEETQSQIDCPACHSAMSTIRVEDIQVDRCPRCGGVWLDALEKDRLLATNKAGTIDTRDRLQAAPHDKVMLCPREHARLIHMVDMKQPQVQFESCKTCGGIFFDAGELGDLNRFTLMERVKNFVRRGL